MSQYADDTTLIVSEDLQSIVNILCVKMVQVCFRP